MNIRAVTTLVAVGSLGTAVVITAGALSIDNPVAETTTPYLTKTGDGPVMITVEPPPLATVQPAAQAGQPRQRSRSYPAPRVSARSAPVEKTSTGATPDPVTSPDVTSIVAISVAPSLLPSPPPTESRPCHKPYPRPNAVAPPPVAPEPSAVTPEPSTLPPLEPLAGQQVVRQTATGGQSSSPRPGPGHPPGHPPGGGPPR